MGLLDGLEDQKDYSIRGEKILRAPFSYPGGKARSVLQIIPHLPETDRYIEPFGGSAAVLLARKRSSLEVYNDRYGGVVAFYRCIRDHTKMQQLVDRLELTVYSREEFAWSKETWEHDVSDDVERAARWYYIVNNSFGSLCRNFGRTLTPKSKLVYRIANKIKKFADIHERFKHVQVENQDWSDCMKDYDHKDSVFYCDPPYVDAYRGTYKHEMTIEEHQALIDTVFHCKGFVAISGYANPLYDNQDWDNVIEWDSFVSIQAGVFKESNHKKHLEHIDKREHTTEKLWIKEAQ